MEITSIIPFVLGFTIGALLVSTFSLLGRVRRLEEGEFDTNDFYEGVLDRPQKRLSAKSYGGDES